METLLSRVRGSTAMPPGREMWNPGLPALCHPEERVSSGWASVPSAHVQRPVRALGTDACPAWSPRRARPCRMACRGFGLVNLFGVQQSPRRWWARPVPGSIGWVWI